MSKKFSYIEDTVSLSNEALLAVAQTSEHLEQLVILLARSAARQAFQAELDRLH